MRSTWKTITIALALVTAAASRARAQSPCALATKEGVSAITGFKVDAMMPQSAGGVTSCVYGAKTRESLQVRTYSGEAARNADALCRGGTPVTGIGDHGCVVTRGPAVMLQIMKGAKVLLLVWLNAPPAAQDRLEQLAVRVIARL